MVRFRLRLHLQEFALPGGRTIIGRGASCNLTIEDVLMSRDHALVRVSDGCVTIRDLGSRNGTMVNGARVEDELELHDGDRVRLGSTELVFSRVVTPRRDVVSTASIRTCYVCGAPHVARAPNCPRCGAASGAGPAGAPRSESQNRRDFWLSLEVELLDKAIEMFRLDEASESMRRLTEKLDALIEAKKAFEVSKIDAALRAAVRFSHIGGAGRCIGWVFDVLRRVELVPSPELFAIVAATPPSVLEEASEPLRRLIEAHRARRALTPSEESCLRSLEKLHDEVIAFKRFRTMDTAPRSAVAAVQ